MKKQVELIVLIILLFGVTIYQWEITEIRSEELNRPNSNSYIIVDNDQTTSYNHYNENTYRDSRVFLTR
jgi:hypothetical protein